MSRLCSLLSATSLATVLAALAPACGTSDAAAPPAAPKQAQPASTPDVKALCVEILTRNRTCTDQYIPALVDLRAKYDRPSGIAADVAANRDAVIAQAKTEWATDSQPAAITATCANITSQLGPDDQSDLAPAQACLAIQDCAAYTTCIMPHFEKRFAK
ncbi:MAG TPA: hypothetical protein VN253_19350 [Kofleriaceae bacterium]|nr:hypothetical protein [Kofleriaceae bacterium]